MLFAKHATRIAMPKMVPQMSQMPLIKPHTLSIRLSSNSSTHQNYFKLFPHTFPNGGPPQDSFTIDAKSLRKEYLTLSRKIHPDVTGSSKLMEKNRDSQEASSVMNHAYAVLKSPLQRAQHCLLINNYDVTSETGNDNGARLRQRASQDPESLMLILDIHEQLESCKEKGELSELKEENEGRIEETEKEIADAFAARDFEKAGLLTIKLKYWYNIREAIKEWAPGKEVRLTH